MKTLAKSVAIVVAVLLIAFVAFYFWASNSTYNADDYASIHNYNDARGGPLPDTLRVATYNIGYLSGMANNRPVREPESFYLRNMASARDLLVEMDADVVGLQEIDFRSRRSYDHHQMDALAAAGYAYGAMAVNWDARYVPFPYGLPRVNFGRMLSGQAVLSRVPILRQERVVLEQPPNPFWYNAFYLDRLAQIVVLDSDPTLAVVNVHLEAFHRETRERHAEALIAIVDSLAADHAILLIGDFNAVPEQLADGDSVAEATMTRLEGHPVLDAVYASGAFGDRVPGTYPADEPVRKIDHILYDARYLEPVEAAVLDAEGPPADHRPVVAAFRRIDGPGIGGGPAQ